MTDAFYSLTSNAMFGAALTIFAYLIGVSANKKLRTPIANPVLRRHNNHDASAA